MAINIAINGYGRIGRNILRALYEYNRTDEFKIVAVNDLGDPKTNAHLTRYDGARQVRRRGRGRRRFHDRQRRPDQGAGDPQSGRAALA